MAQVQVDLKPGTWLVADCSKIPSKNNCQVVMMAPEAQKEDLMEAGIAHMVHAHEHSEADARTMMKEQGDAAFETIEVAETAEATA